MIAAIYARKSTEQNGVADEARSVTRQTDRARGVRATEGTVAQTDVRLLSALDALRRAA